MKKILALLLSMLVVYAGYQLLDKGYRKTYTNGEYLGIEIGASKEAVLKSIIKIDHVSAVLINGKTFLFEQLVSVPLSDRPDDERWVELMSSLIWEFSPNVGHKYFWLSFEQSRLVKIEYVNYFFG